MLTDLPLTPEEQHRAEIIVTSHRLTETTELESTPETHERELSLLRKLCHLMGLKLA